MLSNLCFKSSLAKSKFDFLFNIYHISIGKIITKIRKSQARSIENPVVDVLIEGFYN